MFELQPADLANDIRALHETYDREWQAASRYLRSLPWWRVASMSALRAASRAWQCRRRLRLLHHNAYTLEPGMVRRTFENDNWRVQEADADLYVNGLMVWPVPPFRLISVIATLTLRRQLNLVPEYDEHGQVQPGA